MEIIIYYLLCLLARKKIVLNISYFLGTIVFISLSYNTANKLYKVPGGRQFVPSQPLITDSPISNNSLPYEERIEFLRNHCHDKSDPSASKLHDLIRRNNILNYLGFVLRSHSLFYCSVPKVATRTLLTYITYLHIQDELISSFGNNSTPYYNKNLDPFNAEYLNKMLPNAKGKDSLSLLSHFLTIVQYNSSQIDLWAAYAKTVLPYTRLRSLSDPSIVVTASFIRAIFVRHPLERLASAYADKIASFKAEPFSLYDSLRRQICRRFSSSYLTITERKFYYNNKAEKPINEPCEKIVPTFEHFVEHIMSNSAQADVHWQPYSTLCNACALKYNFIGKYETMQDDLNSLRSKIGLNSTDWNVDNHFSTGKTKENYKLLYSKLPNSLICNLKDFYNEDMKLFNYKFEDYLIDYKPITCPHQHYRRFQTINN